MLDLKFVREHAEAVRKGLKDKGYTLDITPLLSLDEQRRQLLQEVEALKCERNKANDEISGLKRSGGDPAAKIAEMKSISQKIGNLDSKVDEIVEKIADFSLRIPNMPHISVPIEIGRASCRERVCLYV